MNQGVQEDRSVQQALTALATGLHQLMRPCDGEVCLELLLLLADGERGVGARAEMLLLDMPAVSTRLATLKQQGLVVCRADGSRGFYSLSDLVRVSTTGSAVGKKGAGVQRQMVMRCSGGGELSIGMPEEMVERLRRRWEAMGDAEAESRAGEEIRVCKVSVRELAARARAVVTRGRVGKTSTEREKGRAGRGSVAMGA